ncbi:MAG: hypothetical protein J1F35_00555 [Erysipelotrichales bacterium]|nr:hypothetical protein [Erysipelotrichales bacterium]
MADKKTIKKILIALCIVIVLFVGNLIYNEVNYFEKRLTCTFNSTYTNYKETLTFNFVDNTLYEYIREEHMSPSGSSTIEELLEFFNGEREKVEPYLNENFNYEVTQIGDKVKIYTHIKTLFNEEFYNSYIEEKDITMASTIDEVKEKLSDEYTCEIRKIR